MKPFRIESAPVPLRRRPAGWPDGPLREVSLREVSPQSFSSEPTARDVPGEGERALIRSELLAIGAETCTAALRILSMTEQLTELLHAHGLGEQADPLVVELFEACSFQDLTGQRVGKILALMEGRPVPGTVPTPPCPDAGPAPGMLNAPAPPSPPQPPVASDAEDLGRSLINGPRVAGATGHMDQSDIDAMFD
jgi:chemotaxis protein CheZ